MGDIPSACIASSVAAIGGVAVCAALSSKSQSDALLALSGGNGALWGLVTGVGSGGLMLMLRGRQHVIPCHAPCYAGFVPPTALAWWAASRNEQSRGGSASSAADGGEKRAKASSKPWSFLGGFATAMLGGLTLVFYVSPVEQQA